MASWMVHLRIADELLKTWGHLDETAFVMGNIAPDSGVPNENWTAYHPPKQISHFKTKPEEETFFDLESFCEQYFNENLIKQYSPKEYSFFLGYYVHLLTDVQWTDTVYLDLLNSHPEECAKDKHGLIWAAKGDWYDLDFLYLEQHPDFRTFSVYENAINYENIFMDMFAKDAFENRRQYICWFYHGDRHGDLHREYNYLTQAQADAFVERTVQYVLDHQSLSQSQSLSKS